MDNEADVNVELQPLKPAVNNNNDAGETKEEVKFNQVSVYLAFNWKLLTLLFDIIRTEIDVNILYVLVA